MTMGDQIRTMTNKELNKMITDLFYSIPEQDDKEAFREGIEEVLAEEM